LKCHRILGLQEHFTIKRTHLELSMIERHDTEQSRAELSDKVRAKTSREEFWFEMLPEDSRLHRRDDARRQAATGNERPPMVEWRIGSTSVDVDSDLRGRCVSMSATLWSSSARYGGAVKCRNGTWALPAWTWSAAALAANVGRRAVDWQPHTFSLRKEAGQRRSAQIEADWVDYPAVRRALRCRSQAEAWRVTRLATAEPALSEISKCSKSGRRQRISWTLF